jgi:hypothetical protein
MTAREIGYLKQDLLMTTILGGIDLSIHYLMAGGGLNDLPHDIWLEE